MNITSAMVLLLNKKENRHCLERFREDVKKMEPTFENHVFLPERWVAGDPLAASKFAKSTFHPFGLGRHICLGYSLAKVAMAANFYCFARKENRIISFDEDKVIFENKLIPEKGIKDHFPGTVVLED
ncbi:unnamed protein product [Cylindrotheca closterium]|uniref:Cytochrome P450 n=1 Tax=Cylindrotheca closterium TaxID=2856 RepID=A0AAD2G969_9STRA|nr:unnamed protein product [Cylindrotheca closterium]